MRELAQAYGVRKSVCSFTGLRPPACCIAGGLVVIVPISTMETGLEVQAQSKLDLTRNVCRVKG
jgi:hypothetical protein